MSLQVRIDTGFTQYLTRIICLHRWTSTAKDLKKVTQFEYEAFSDAAVTELVQRVKTPAERYREAVRATHLIANEMADIEDQSEFDEMLTFVLDQWRNVRQRKIAAGQPELEDTRANGSNNDADVKREFGICSSEEEDSGEDELNVGRGSPIKIRLNPKAKKVGRPAKQKKKTSAGERADRKWYACAEEGRKVAGEVSLARLLVALDRDQPGLMLAQRRLAGIIVKYSEADNKKPKYKIMKNPVLILDPFYILPPKLLHACVKLLPVAHTEAEAIVIDEESQASLTHAKNSKTGASTETIIVKDVGNYSREQIEIFRSVQNLKSAIQLGLDTHKWLVDEGLPALPAEYHSNASKVGEDILGTYPKKQIQGLPMLPEFQFSLLYTVKPTTWLSDGAIRALCERLVNDYPGCRFAGFQDAVMMSKKTRSTQDNPVQDRIRDRIIQQVGEPGVDVVLLPLNFHNAHWCCVVVRVEVKRIFYYDPLNQASYLQSARSIATFLKISGLESFDVIQQNNPIQFDTFSCGVFVSWMLIRHTAGGHPLDECELTVTTSL